VSSWRRSNWPNSEGDQKGGGDRPRFAGEAASKAPRRHVEELRLGLKFLCGADPRTPVPIRMAVYTHNLDTSRPSAFLFYPLALPLSLAVLKMMSVLLAGLSVISSYGGVCVFDIDR
jgi:hypothetical protein